MIMAAPAPSAASSSVVAVEDVTQAPQQGRPAVLLFWAPWNDASKPGGPMDRVLAALAQAQRQDSDGADAAASPIGGGHEGAALFGRVDAEECPDLADALGVEAVPTIVCLTARGEVAERVVGEDAAAATQAARRLLRGEPSPAAPLSAAAARVGAPPSPAPEEELGQRLARLVRASEVVLFMKGTPAAPRCGFSRQVVELLEGESIEFGAFDVLGDERVRQGLKTYSNWPTYPQLYVNGSLVGGLDILKEMKEEGSLREQLGISALASPSGQAAPPPPPPQTLEERLAGLTTKEPIMLFMKGLPSAPRCGFSRQIVEILEGEGVPFGAFDILGDDEVRQGLKKYSNWPTYPQLYANGALVGGLDIVKELKEDGSLKEALQSP